MKTHRQRFSVIHSNNADPTVPARNSGYRIAALAVVLALALLAAANWVRPDQTGSQSGAAVKPAGYPNASTEFVYFPGQYVNQATEPTEHIQAF